jgi:hypothetical protein
MPNEVILFGGSIITIAAVATLATALLMRWRQTPLPSFRPFTRPAPRRRRLLPW